MGGGGDCDIWCEVYEGIVQYAASVAGWKSRTDNSGIDSQDHETQSRPAYDLALPGCCCSGGEV